MITMTPAQTIGLSIALWFVTVATLAFLGVFERFPPPLGIGPLIILGIVLPTLAYALLPSVRHAVARLGLWWITLFHAWRIPAALLFFWYGDQGLLPTAFVQSAGWGDALAGVLALAAVVVGTRAAFWTFHVVGAADFVVAVGTGLTLTVLTGPTMASIATFPVVLIPLFGVGLSGASHIIAFHLLLQGDRAAPASRQPG